MLKDPFLAKWYRLGRLFGRAMYLVAAATAIAIAPLSLVHAQDIEPRAYSSAPIGVNPDIAGYANTEGALPFDASLPINNAQVRTSNAVLAYARVLDLWGNSGKFDVIVPLRFP